MKFFKFEEMETVAAKTEEQAIDFYAELVGRDKESLFIEEVPSTETMWAGADILTDEEDKQPQTFQNGPTGFEVLVSLETFVSRQEVKLPAVIATTER